MPDGGLAVHVGPHKTGTTAVQEAFAERREHLRSMGVVFPGPYPADHDAVRARLRTPGGWDDAVPPPHRTTWQRLTAQTRDVAGTVLVSSEALSHATVRQAAQVCEELRPGVAHRAIITVRPFTEVVPSAWQEYVKSGWTTDFDTFLQVLVDGPEAESPTPTFWRRHDHGALARRWANALGADAVTVIVTDRRRPDLLIGAFETLLGLATGTLPTAGGTPNRSLTMSEIELVRQINVRVRHEMPWESYNLLIRAGGLPALIGRRTVPTDELRVTLPAWADEAARGIGRRSKRRIVALEVPVIGDLRRLGEPGPPNDGPADVTTVARDVVQLLVAGMSASAADHHMRRTGVEFPPVDVERVVRSAAGDGSTAPIDRCAAVLAELAVDLDQRGLVRVSS